MTDESEDLVKFCETLESILSKGLKPQLSPLGFGREGDVWTWMSFFGDQRKGSVFFSSPVLNTGCTFNKNSKITLLFFNRATFGYEFAVSSVKKDPKVSTNAGRTRLLIRTCLSHHCLFKPIEMLVCTWFLFCSLFIDSASFCNKSLLEYVRLVIYNWHLDGTIVETPLWLMKFWEKFCCQ